MTALDIENISVFGLPAGSPKADLPNVSDESDLRMHQASPASRWTFGAVRRDQAAPSRTNRA
jgi:hypothetical protein